MPKTNAISSSSLTLVQRRLLADAARRQDGALVLPRRVNGRMAAAIAQVLLGHKLVREIRAKADLPVWRQDSDGQRFSLVLTRAGRNVAAAEAERAAEPGLSEGLQPQYTAGAPAATVPAPVVASPRTGSKLDEVVTLLRRDTGTSISELTAATGWLPHTTRAALTGLRKRGFDVSRQAAGDGSGSVYRIVEAQAAA